MKIYTSLISAYTKCDNPWQAIKLWEELKTRKMQPTSISYVSILAACAKIGDDAAQLGEYIQNIFF